jgi:hypothetical protein
VPYYQLTERRFSSRFHSKPWLIVALTALLFAILMVSTQPPSDAGAMSARWLFFGVAAVAGAGFLWSRRHLTGLVGNGASLWFRADEPTLQDLNAFIAELLRHRAACLERSGYRRAVSPVEQLEKLVALRDRGAISSAEFDAMKGRILNGDPPFG